jgi:hypothetical protein
MQEVRVPVKVHGSEEGRPRDGQVPEVQRQQPLPGPGRYRGSGEGAGASVIIHGVRS